MRLHDLLAGLESNGAIPPELRGEPGVEIDSIVHDSREAGAGSLFCCIRGLHHDGHLFAADAVAAGAVALLVKDFVDVDVPQARVRSVRGVLGPIAARFNGAPSQAMRVLGVTGTNGKTTTTYLLEAIADAAGDRTGVIGTVSARIGDRLLPSVHTTPEATELQATLAAMRDDDVATVAMEVSSHALDQHRVDETSFAATCFINLSHDHLDYHGSLHAYFDAKARLFTPAFTRRAAVHVGDEHGARLARRAADLGLVVSRFAIDPSDSYGPDADGPETDVSARNVRLMADSTSFDLVACGREPVPVRTALVGTFNVVNALAAAATAFLAGFDLEAVIDGLERPIVVPGRMERIDAGQDFTAIVDYAHTPDALRNALGAARELAGSDGRVIVVFGCGGDRDRAKRPVMGGIAARLADRTYVTTDNPRSEDPGTIIEEIVAGMPAGDDPANEDRGGDVVTVADRRMAIGAAIAAARSGDVVLVAGKGHETGQTVNGETLPFDDRVAVRAELAGRS